MLLGETHVPQELRVHLQKNWEFYEYWAQLTILQQQSNDKKTYTAIPNKSKKLEEQRDKKEAPSHKVISTLIEKK